MTDHLQGKKKATYDGDKGNKGNIIGAKQEVDYCFKSKEIQIEKDLV